MPSIKKPRRGSMAYYPRKRASRIHQTVNSFSDSDKPKAMVFAGYKVGMTHVIITDNRKTFPTFGQEIQVPATILECPPLNVLGVRAYRNSVKGPIAMNDIFAKELPKNVSRKLKVGKYKTDEKIADVEKNIDKVTDLRFVVCTTPEKTAFGKKTPEIFEIGIGGKDVKEKLEFAKGLIGKEIKIQDVLQEGEAVDAIGVTIGKGVQGPVKRFGVAIQNRHAKQKLRHVGAIGGQVPRKLRFTVRHAGQMGFQRRTELNKRVVKIGEGKDVVPKSGVNRYGILKSDFVLVSGSVPGPKKRLIALRSAIRPPKVKVDAPDVKYISK